MSDLLVSTNQISPTDPDLHRTDKERVFERLNRRNIKSETPPGLDTSSLVMEITQFSVRK
jgi:hypothetical protein